jgi:hypothetical protein
VITILSFKKGIIRYQFSQLAWTWLTIAIVVLQVGKAPAVDQLPRRSACCQPAS